MNWILLQDVVSIVVLVVLSVPLGIYTYRVMMGERVFLSGVIGPVERCILRFMDVPGDDEMSAKKYIRSVLLFSFVGFLLLMALLMAQGWLPLNPQKFPGVPVDLAFNISASFVTNTNWQAYAGQTTLSNLTQLMGLTVQNFVSAATGMSVVFALIRGFIRKQMRTLGSFWVDLVRSVLYVMLPLSVLVALLLVSQGVVQSFDAFGQYAAYESGALQTLPLGPAASQIAIKQLGTNGGGFFGANSAYPLENPTALSNWIQLLSILLIPASLCVAFGHAVNDKRQGRTLYVVMLVLFVGALAATTLCELHAAPEYAGVVVSGNLEGKEVLHGIGGSTLWATATTAASNGSVNASLDSFTPLGGLVPMFLMQLGEIVFGGIGSGLYGMLAFVLLTVFIAGLMVGRTPEYLGKKVEPFDMKMVCLIVLIPPVLTLLGTAVAVMMPEAQTWLGNSGAHGFSEILYAFTSMGNNNGSAFAGFVADTSFANLIGGMMMLLGRFVPLIAVLYLAGNMAGKKAVASGDGTLSTANLMFAGLLLGVILIIAALSFLPALALGPMADHFNMR
ncbi:MAG: potassium-transporting ATPase subunit KdpA [Clostridia bacterium]